MPLTAVDVDWSTVANWAGRAAWWLAPPNEILANEGGLMLVGSLGSVGYGAAAP